MSLEGRQIGRYRLVRLLGSGGMGDVYLAEDVRIEQQVAIKVIRAEVSPYSEGGVAEKSARLFLREARAIAKLDHPNILPLFDFGEEQVGDTTIMYLVMPYRQEGSLASWLRQRARGELLIPQEVANIVQQAAAALQHAHNRQVIHQDVKPSNFLLRSREDAPALPDLLLADFGIARFMTATSSASQSIRGTPSYMAPEQWEGEPTPATDQYALAVMTYELLTGRLPFQGGPGKMMYQHIHVQPQRPSTINLQLLSEIDSVLLQALAKPPEQRFASITAFAKAFRQAAEGMQSAQELRGTSKIERVDKIVLPVSLVGIDTAAPTVPHSRAYPIENESETDVRPTDAPSPLTSDVPLLQEASSSKGGKPSQQNAEEVIEDTSKRSSRVNLARVDIAATLPGVPPKRTHRKTRRRPVLLAGLIILVLAMAGGGIAYAVLSAAIYVTVTITPASRDVRNTYTITAVTGIPDTSKEQVGARLLSVTTPTQTQTVKTTGKGGTIPGTGTHASGLLAVGNFSSPPTTIIIKAGTVIPNNEGPGLYQNLEMVMDATELSGYGTAIGMPAHVAQIGTIGNIPDEGSSSLFTYCSGGPGTYATGCSCPNCWWARTAGNFTGGTDPQTYTLVQQKDIDSAANILKVYSPDPWQVLQPQIHSNEQLINSPQCKPNVNSDHKVGNQAKSVTVTVNFTCSGEVYDRSATLSMATKLLLDQATTDLGAHYALKGSVETTLTQATLTNATKRTITLAIDAEGIWMFQFSDIQKQALAKLIAGKSRQDTLTLLLAQQGIAKATIQISGGDRNTVPTNIKSITIVVLAT